MLRASEITKSESGRQYHVERPLEPGGEGQTYVVTEVNSGEKLVLKVFHSRFNNAETRTRIRFLLAQNFKAVCPAIEPPVDILDMKDNVGHYTPYVGERSLEDHLAKPEATFLDGVQFALALAHAINTMHVLKIAYGDIHPGNLRITKRGSVLMLHVIDLDNINAPGLPEPHCIGQNLYMAPELRAALATGRAVFPSIESDRFALGVAMHEILLLCHPASGCDESEEAFNRAMCSGIWLLDPVRSDRLRGTVGGFPVGVLNADLAGLFRAVFSLDPTKRPSASNWETVLFNALNSIFQCPQCGCLFAIDSSKTACPECGHVFPYLSLHVIGGRRVLSLKDASTTIGRNDLGGSMHVSARHAIFRRVGPETWIESYGLNGTYRRNGSQWVRLPDAVPLAVKVGDLLRLGDVEVQLT